MTPIDNNTMQHAAELLIKGTPANVEVHTVTLQTNGQHGGVDMVIQGNQEGGPLGMLEDWETKFILR